MFQKWIRLTFFLRFRAFAGNDAIFNFRTALAKEVNSSTRRMEKRGVIAWCLRHTQKNHRYTMLRDATKWGVTTRVHNRELLYSRFGGLPAAATTDHVRVCWNGPTSTSRPRRGRTEHTMRRSICMKQHLRWFQCFQPFEHAHVIYTER